MVAPDFPLRKTWLPQLDNWTEGNHTAPSTSSGGMAGSLQRAGFKRDSRRRGWLQAFSQGSRPLEANLSRGSPELRTNTKRPRLTTCCVQKT